MKNYDVLVERLDLFSNVRAEIDRILYEYENYIKEIINNIRSLEDKDKIYLLFEIQDKLSLISYKYEYNTSNFLCNFIYELDRQDEESVIYLLNEILENKNFFNK